MQLHVLGLGVPLWLFATETPPPFSRYYLKPRQPGECMLLCFILYSTLRTVIQQDTETVNSLLLWLQLYTHTSYFHKERIIL